jgi:prevent-host-death family protein
MEYISFISKTDLARKTRQVIHSVQRGQTVIVESHGQPEAAIMDMPDYYILLAATRYHAHPQEIDRDAGLTEDSLSGLSIQGQYDRVIAHYLAEAISFGRAAELLDLPWVDLRTRFNRLGLPILLGLENVDELRSEMETLDKWEKKINPRV